MKPVNFRILIYTNLHSTLKVSTNLQSDKKSPQMDSNITPMTLKLAQNYLQVFQSLSGISKSLHKSPNRKKTAFPLVQPPCLGEQSDNPAPLHQRLRSSSSRPSRRAVPLLPQSHCYFATCQLRGAHIFMLIFRVFYAQITPLVYVSSPLPHPSLAVGPNNCQS